MDKLTEQQKELNKFKKTLVDKTMPELEAIEQDLIKEADAQGEELGKMEFDMPTENYEQVAEFVRMFLEKQSVQWQYALGLVVMYEFWDPKKRAEKIPYPHLDSILRTFGNMQFTGYKEWVAIVAINKYFEPLSKAYADATEETFNIALKHDAVLKAMELLKPVKHE